MAEFEEVTKLPIPTAGFGYNLLRNGDFELWSAGASAAPDGWAAKTGTSISQVTDRKLGSYAVSVANANGTDGYLRQSVPRYADFKGLDVTFQAWVKSAASNRQRLRINDGVGSTYSAYHSGGGGWELLSVTRTIASNATELSIDCYVDSGGVSSATFDGAILIQGKSQQAFVPSSLRIYDSGWFQIAPLGTATKAHGLGTWPLFVTVWCAESASPTKMSVAGPFHIDSSGSGERGAYIDQCDTTNIHVRAGNYPGLKEDGSGWISGNAFYRIVAWA